MQDQGPIPSPSFSFTNSTKSKMMMRQQHQQDSPSHQYGGRRPSAEHDNHTGFTPAMNDENAAPGDAPKSHQKQYRTSKEAAPPQQQPQQPLSEEVFHVTFHGVEYMITIVTDYEQQLTVDLEQEGTDNRWLGHFPAQYIEDITHKTGNFKRFSVLVKMLTAALAQQSDSVFIDLLTFADLVSHCLLDCFICFGRTLSSSIFGYYFRKC
eukprot:gb/GECG01000354.1/.p1 GENE.gb/GECG01000354.1/~~gb/GECG01000354.1/.p1  ORF type:complete len:209 (+),score=24.72 gb/GECG01000354.1/:1-627(+)